VGEWLVTELSDGFFRLDGGSMWGVVPATMWRKLTPPAEDNTIRLALRPFLAERGREKIVIEVGLGQRWDAKKRAIYRMEPTVTLAQSLARAGVGVDEVTHVVATHCHWDHIGGQVVERDGVLAPLFQNARHFAPKVEIARAKKPGHARAASYRADDVLAIESAGLLTAYEGDFEVVPGLVAHVLGGHSDGVSVVTLGAGTADGAIFWSDVVPTTHHVEPAYIMAYDVDVARSFEVRSEWIERAVRERWIGLFYHDERHAFARIVREGKRFACLSIDI
jgi:glyoxylase-like metal-dependent hydrolase (beta-lactamase superfamily II)